MLDRNVRGIGIALCLLTLFIFLSGCGSLKDDTLLTVNAVITEVDTGKQTITVKDDADENTLGEERAEKTYLHRCVRYSRVWHRAGKC